MLEQVFERFYRMLRGVAAGILIDDDLVDDALQEAFTRALESGRECSEEREALNFLNRVLINTSIDLYRKRKRSCRIFRAAPDPWEDSVSHGIGTVQPQEHEDPLAGLLRKERRHLEQSLLEEVQVALEELPRGQRQAISLLLNRNGKSCREVCAEAGIPYSTVRSRMRGGIDRIRAVVRRGKLFQALRGNDDAM